MSATATDPSGVDVAVAAPPGFGATLASEWSKLTSLRSARVTVVLGIVLGIVVTGLLCWAVVATWDEWPPEERATFDPTETSLVGVILTAVFFAVLGLTSVTSEYSSRMIALTFTATPRRERVLLAKMLVVAALTALGTLVAVIGMIVVARTVFAGYDLPSPGAGRTAHIVLGITAGSPLFPVIGVAVAFVLRSAAGSVVALLGLIFGPLAFAPLLPRWWQEQGQRYLPGQATDSLTLRFLDDPAQLGIAMAALTLAAWLVAIIGLAAVVVARRDA